MGNWVNDQATGKTRVLQSDGSVFEGEYEDGKASCFFGMRNNKSDASTYFGAWLNGCEHGQGRTSWQNGSSYKGTYGRGKRHGEGQMCWADGRQYKGQWSNDKMEGAGKYVWADGRKYEGRFFNDDMTKISKKNKAKYTWPDGSKYAGRWEISDQIVTQPDENVVDSKYEEVKTEVKL